MSTNPSARDWAQHAETCQAVRFTPYVRDQLLQPGRALVPNDLRGMAPTVWHQRMAHLGRHIVGLMLMRPLYAHGPLTRLSVAQDAVRQYWSNTRYRGTPALFFELLARDHRPPHARTTEHRRCAGQCCFLPGD